jgi:hypothetical protein
MNSHGWPPRLDRFSLLNSTIYQDFGYLVGKSLLSFDQKAPLEQIGKIKLPFSTAMNEFVNSPVFHPLNQGVSIPWA